MGQLEGCQKIPKKISEVRREVIWWSKRYNWHKTIEKSCLSFTVWPHERSTFEEKKWHEKAIFPVLQKLTRMSVCDWQQNSITKDNLFCQVLTLVVAIPTHQGHIQEVSGSHTLLQLNHIFRIFYLKYLRRIGKDMETIARIMEY